MYNLRPKWLTVGKQHWHMHLLKINVCIWIKMSRQVALYDRTDKTLMLVYVMACCRSCIRYSNTHISVSNPVHYKHGAVVGGSFVGSVHYWLQLSLTSSDLSWAQMVLCKSLLNKALVMFCFDMLWKTVDFMETKASGWKSNSSWDIFLCLGLANRNL